ncbi:MAG: DUF420 domain-containing protein [Bacteroidetes bacterium]|nr:DUF420 domain-containing protein [Bacteroidota bacterium]
MTELVYNKNEKLLLRIIIAVSIIVPLLVSVLLFSPVKIDLPVSFVRHLPTVNAVLNSTTAVLLILALRAIRKNNIIRHKQLMLSAMVLGMLFLVFYVVYHSSMPSAVYGDINGDGLRDATEKAAIGNGLYFYLVLLLSHIVFAAVVLPFVLMAAFYGIQDKLSKHRKVVKWAYPMWLFVSISGVLVYLMISPYYGF